jgi:DNA repair protein SbcD/Mre11
VRILHTSDWHAGRFWFGKNRLGELASVLEDMIGLIERERVDLLLVTGDVFDNGAPVPEAERVVFGFLKRVGRAGTKTVVIAGNHDSPARLEAWGSLAELAEVRVVARPCSAARGGVLEIGSRQGETAVVAAVPFAATRQLVSAVDLADDDTRSRQRYADGMRAVVDDVSSRFRPDAVNLLMAHTHLEGALFSGSERRVHVSEEWAALPQALPATAHYVALGHIHRPQRLEAAPAPAFYAGSPLQLDFGEAGEEKTVMLVDARPRQPARWEAVPCRGGATLRRVRASLQELERDAEALRGAGWLQLTVPLDSPDPDLVSRLHRLLPNVVSVKLDRPRAGGEPAPGPPRGASARELFEAYTLREHGAPADEALLEAFAALHEAAAGEGP